MATAGEALECVDQFNCPICIEKFVKPRSLPTCLHTFCENCLFTFVFNLKKNGDLVTTFECPICRKPHASPENGEVTLEWIQTFPLNHMMDSNKEIRVEGQLDSVLFCEPCKETGDSIHSVKYCLDCQNYLCETCMQYHYKFKPLKSHKLIDAKELSEDFTHTSHFAKYTKCPKHPDRDVELYCKDDDSLCCIKCDTVNHRSCREVIDIADAGSQAKENAKELETKLKTVKDHLIMLKSLKTENTGGILTELGEIPQKLADMRDKVVKLMNEMVDDVTTKSKQIKKEVESHHEEGIHKLDTLTQLCEKKMNMLESMLKHGSDRHVFISVQYMNDEFAELEEKLLKEDSNQKRYNINLNISDELINLSEKSVDFLAGIKLQENESEHVQYDSLRSLKESKMAKTGEHTVRLIEQCSPTYRGVSMHKNIIVLSDFCGLNCGFVCMYDPLEQECRKLKMKQPFSAAFIDDKHIAVSLPNDKNICIVSVTLNGMKVEKSLKTKTKPKSLVVLKNGQMAVSWNDPPAFGIVVVSGSEIIQNTYLGQDKTGRKFRSFDYLAVDERRSHIIQPCTEDKAVYCFDYTGEPVFKYTDSRLECPKGVALDRDGNIYVCDNSVHNHIHKLSPGGQQICIIKDNIPRCPMAICFDKMGTKLSITGGSGNYTKVCCYELVKK